MAAPSRPLTLVVCGVILTALLLVVAFNIDAGREPESDGNEVIEITGPAPLSDADRVAARETPTVAPVIPEGGWIQIAGSDGNLAQQYRFSRLDPDPAETDPGWMALEQPVMEIYGSDGRVVELRGDKALVYSPNETLERGTLTGSVVIHVYDSIAGATLDPLRDHPSVRVRTDDAQFDGVIGEVRCDGAIHMESARGEFFGRHLTALFDDRGERLQRLWVEQVDSIRLTQAALTEEVPPGSASQVRSAPLDEDATVYRLTLRDDVVITQGDSSSPRTATGDALSVIFTFESSPEQTAALPPRHAHPVSLEVFLATAALTTQVDGQSLRDDGLPPLAPPPSPDDAYVTCTGGLEVVPADEDRSRLVSADDTLMELVGTPVRLEDAAEAAVVTGGKLEYRGLDRRFDLVRTAAHELVMATPQLEARAEHFWLEDGIGRGGFTGPGTAHMQESAADAAAAPSGAGTHESRTLDLAWSTGVDLHFGDGSGPAEADAPEDAAPSEDGAMAALGALERAIFRGAVTARGTPGSLDCETLDVGLAQRADGTGIETLDATGAVMAHDETRAIWTEALSVGFVERDGSVEIGPVRARGGLQIRLDEDERVFAEAMDADAEARTAVLTGADVRLVDGPHLIDRTRRVAIDEGTLRYDLEGQGRFRRFDRPVLETTGDRVEPVMLDVVSGASEELRITWDDGVTIEPLRAEAAAGTDGSGVDAVLAITPDAAAADAPTAVRAETTPRAATFRGNVRVLSPEMRLEHADRLVATLAPSARGATGAGDASTGSGADARASGVELRSILATGNVIAENAADPGTIRCETLLVDNTTGADGRVLPERMVATGAVSISDGVQVLWTERLETTFVAAAPKAGDGADAVDPRAAGEEGEDGAVRMARVDIDRVHATGGVRARLADGELVYAETLEGRGRDETAALTGPSIVILGDRFRLEEATRVELDQKAGSYRVASGGRFTSYAAPGGGRDGATSGADSGASPAGSSTTRDASLGRRDATVTAADGTPSGPERPAPQAPPATPPAAPNDPVELVATWTRSATFQEPTALADDATDTTRAAPASGRQYLVLEGDVHAESTPAAATSPEPAAGETPEGAALPPQLDRSTVDADRLTLEFEPRGIDNGATSSSAGADADVLASGGRRLVAFTAEGIEGKPAKIEHRALDATMPDAPPRLFFLDGPRIEYEPESLEGTVTGAGRLLVRDERPDAEDASGAATSARGGFARRGTTLFRWTDGMEMRHVVEDRFRIEMRGNIEVLNRGTDGTTATMTGQVVEALVRRSAATDAEAGADGAATNPLDAGGALEVLRIMARGGVLVRTADRDVTCDEFDYTLSTGIAVLNAAPGRSITIMTSGAPRPVTARRVIWNMDRDSITIEGGGVP